MIIFFVNNKIGDNMKKILFTGARSGIINKVIDTIINDYYIYLTVENDLQLKRVCEKYKSYSNVKCFKLDITNIEDRNKIKDIDIDIFVSNAAIGEGGSVAEIPFNRVRNNYEVNVFSNFELIQLVLNKMIKRGTGKIVIMSSLASIYPIAFLGSYCSTKSSISMLSACLKKEINMINKNIKIKLIEPGLYRTGFNEVMFDNKYDFMDNATFFNSILEKLRKKENFIIKYLTLKNYNSIVRQIIRAIKDDNNKFIYKAPLIEAIGTKIYQMFKW